MARATAGGRKSNESSRVLEGDVINLSEFMTLALGAQVRRLGTSTHYDSVHRQSTQSSSDDQAH